MLGDGGLPEAALRPAVCAADLVCVPTGGVSASSGLCASLVGWCTMNSDPF